MAELVLMTATSGSSVQVLPALGLLPHRVRVVSAEVSRLLVDQSYDLVLVDARQDLAAARSLCHMVALTDSTVPVIAVLTEGGLIAVSADWQLTDIVVDQAGPAEVEARFRLAMAGSSRAPGPPPPTLSSGTLVIDELSYSARVDGRLLDLTYKEFELLKHLVHHPGHVFTRAQLLQEVWGFDYFGGTRTVDVHVRRLRAKLGTEHEALIGTVRNVGYRFVPEDVPG